MFSLHPRIYPSVNRGFFESLKVFTLSIDAVKIDIAPEVVAIYFALAPLPAMRAGCKVNLN